MPPNVHMGLPWHGPQPSLDQPARWSMALDVAHGLEYLHHQQPARVRWLVAQLKSSQIVKSSVVVLQVTLLLVSRKLHSASSANSQDFPSHHLNSNITSSTLVITANQVVKLTDFGHMEHDLNGPQSTDKWLFSAGMSRAESILEYAPFFAKPVSYCTTEDLLAKQVPYSPGGFRLFSLD